ncbi:MAG: M3 family metallopeptidase [Rikenellaceae bacterium]|nr:M3 family metallopeptidase [Rikenellaceae bacterium]
MKRILFVLSLLMIVLNTTFCSKPVQKEGNPLLEEAQTPYGVPAFDRIEAEHYEPAFEYAMSLHNEEVAAILANKEEPTFDNTILELDRSGMLLANVSDVFGMMCAAMNNEDMQEIQEKVMPLLAAHYDAISMNEALFKRIKVVYDKRNSTDLNAEQVRLVEKMYDRAVRQGALLNEEQKERLQKINEELSLLTVKFDNNLLAETNDFKLELEAKEVSELPKAVREAAKEGDDENKYIFTLHKPSLIPFLTYSQNRELREKIYKAYLNRCSNDNDHDNKAIINEMVRLRIEKANLLGYKSYSEYVTSEQMAGSPKAVYALLEEIFTSANEKAKEELEEMNRLFKRDHRDDDAKFESWDWWYYAEKVRKQKYSLNEEMTSPYFALDNVRQGAFNLANRLYGLTFRPVIVPQYHNEASAYEVLDNDGSHLGVLYFDFHPRASKSQGAWCGYFRRPSYDREGKRISPVVSIVCNFTRPSGDTPALLSIDEVTTLFHEFGHALHFLFSDVPYNGLLDVEGDFVELPSQIMENWALEPELLKTYAVHYRNNTVISRNLIEKIRRSAQFNQGFMTTELLGAALVDLDIHSLTKYKEMDVESFEYNALYEKRGMIHEIEPRYHLPYFAHIFAGGYSSGYYFYTWAEVLDKDAFAAFSETGDVFHRRTAQAFRKLLASGGSKDGMSLYREFRGAEPSREPLLKARGLWVEPEQPSEEAQTEVEKTKEYAHNRLNEF